MLPKANDIDYILAGGGALAAEYLLSQLEYLFRMKSRYLDGNGIVIKLVPPQLVKKLGSRNTSKGNRISQIKQAFILYLYRNRTPLANRLQSLEQKIKISDRLDYIRNPVMHGPLGDPAVEATFYSLLVSMFYYAESLEGFR